MALGSLAQLALARLPVPPTAARAVVAPRALENRPRHRALLGRRSCSGAVLPLPRYGAFVEVGAPLVQEDPCGDLPVGRRLPSSVLRWRRLKKSRRRRDERHHPRPGPPALYTCPRPSSVDVGEGIAAAASALRSSLLQFGHPERRLLSLLLEWAAVGDLEPYRPAGPPMWGVVRTRGGGTGVSFVMAP